MRNILLTTLVSLLFFTGCNITDKAIEQTLVSTESTNKKEYQSTEVCILLYSGRENPCWSLTPDETETFIDMIKSTSSTEWFSDDSRLGYSGFHIFIKEKNSLTSENFPLRINIFNGRLNFNKDMGIYIDSRVYIDKPNPHLEYKIDTGRTIEQWLLNLSKGRAPETELEAIRETWNNTEAPH